MIDAIRIRINKTEYTLCPLWCRTGYRELKGSQSEGKK